MIDEKPKPDALTRVIELILMVLLGFVTVVSFAQVIMRYVFSNSIIWAEEIGRFGFIWIVFLSAGVLTGTPAHIAFTLLTGRLDPAAQRVAAMVGHLLVAFLGVFVALYGWSIVSIGFDVPAPASEIPMAYIQMILVIFGLLLIWRSLVAIGHALLRKKGA